MSEPERDPTAPFCSLSPDALRERIERIRREVLPRARSGEITTDGRAWDFPASMREALEELVALERECCGDGVEFELAERPGGLRLAVRGIDPHAEVFRALAPAAATRPLRRLCRVGGAGLGLSLAVFCGVPMAATLWLGAAAAAPLAGLDHPAVVALGAVAFAATFWALATRRRGRPPV